MKRTAPRYPNKLLVIGTAVLVAGGVLLMVTLGSFTLPASLWPLPLLAAGLVFLYLAYVRGRSSRYILPGMLLTLCGLFFLLVETVIGWAALERAWPAFMIITGLSLLAWGLRLKPKARTAIIVPGLFIAALGVLLFPFSVQRHPGSLAAFVGRWWPLVLVVIGLVLVASFFTTRKPNRKV
jgi:hypothetical protein